MSKREVNQYLKESEKKISAGKKKLADLEAQAGKAEGRAKAILIVECLTMEKAIIDLMCDNLVACRETVRTGDAKQIRKALLLELRQYNRYVLDYKRLTGINLTQASLCMPDDILSRGAYQVLPILTFEKPAAVCPYLNQPVATERVAADDVDEVREPEEFRDITRREFRKLRKKNEKAIIKHRIALKKKQDKKPGTKGEVRAALIVDCLTIERSILEILIENLKAARQICRRKCASKARRALATEINVYNRMIAEYTKLTGQALTPASTSIPSDIIAGNSYEPIKIVSYKYANPLNEKDEILEELRKFGELREEQREAQGWIDNSVLDAKTKAQANKDMAVLTQQADFEISMLESERDISKFRYGRGHENAIKRRRKIAKQITKIKKTHKAALKCESADNKRYYAVVTNNPDTMKTPRPKPDRVKIASLRTRMISLLNERDLINSKLSAIYTGGEYNIDGTSINQTWRNVKSEAAANAQKKQKHLAKSVKRLNCSESERGRIYEQMNKRVDALSTVALCKYRLKKEDNSAEEVRLIKQDLKKNKRAEKTIEKDIHWMIKKAYKRSLHTSSAFDWIFSAGLILAIVLGITVAFFWLCGGDMIGAITGLLGK